MRPTSKTPGPASRRGRRLNVFGVAGRFAGTRARLFASLLGDECRHVPRILRDLGRRPSFRRAWRYFEQGLGRNFQRLASGARIPAAELDNLGLLGQSRRTIRAVKRVSSQRDLELVDYADLLRRVDAAYDETLEQGTFAAVADCQWLTESLGWSAAAYAEKNGNGCLKDVEVHKPIEPIMHFGIGMYALWSIGESEVDRVEKGIGAWSDEHFEYLSYDGLGLLLAFADSGIRNLHEVYELLEVPTFRPPDANTVRQFLAHLEEASDHLLCRGYGRGLYFLSGSLNSALKMAHQAADAYGLRLDWLAEGVAFAFAMVNSPRPAAVIRAHEFVPEPDQAAVIEGIADNLSFNEFTFTGFLDKLEAAYGETPVTVEARKEAEQANRELSGEQEIPVETGLAEDARRSLEAAVMDEGEGENEGVGTAVAASETTPASVKVTATVRLARAMRAYKAKG